MTKMPTASTDSCDVCPQLDDPRQEDGDRDGVGDGCDPNPTVARDRLVVFDPFTSRRPEWVFPSAPPTYAGDAIAVDTRKGQFRADLEGVPANDTYTFVLRIGAGRAAGFRQVTIYALETNQILYYCDLGMDNSGMGTFQESYTYDAVDYMQMASTTAALPFENSDLVMIMTHAPPTLVCTTSWPVGEPTLDRCDSWWHQPGAHLPRRRDHVVRPHPLGLTALDTLLRWS